LWLRFFSAVVDVKIGVQIALDEQLYYGQQRRMSHRKAVQWRRPNTALELTPQSGE
jgi:hypothetical protein